MRFIRSSIVSQKVNFGHGLQVLPCHGVLVPWREELHKGIHKLTKRFKLFPIRLACRRDTLRTKPNQHRIGLRSIAATLLNWHHRRSSPLGHHGDGDDVGGDEEICPNFLLSLRFKRQFRFSKADVTKGVNRTTTCETIVTCRDINASSSWGSLSSSLQNPKPRSHARLLLLQTRTRKLNLDLVAPMAAVVHEKFDRSRHNPVRLHRFVVDLKLKNQLASKIETQFFRKDDT